MSFLEREFVLATRASRLTGLSLVAINPEREGSRFVARLWTWRSMYGMLVNSISISFEATVLIFKFYSELYEGAFSDIVFNIMLLAMFVKATAGIAAYVLFSRKFVSVLNDMALYEETIRYKPDSGSGFPILTLTLWAVFRSLATTAYIASRYLMYQEISVQQPKALALAVSSVWSVASLFVVYVISNEVYSLATMMYGVLTEYLRHLSDLTQSIMKSETSLCSSKAGFALQKLRLEYLKLRMIVGGLNDILPYSMLVSVTCSLVLLCTSAYVVTHPGDSWRKHVFSTCYGINLILELFKLVQASTNLKKKSENSVRRRMAYVNAIALKMHEMLDAIPTYHVPSHVIAQMAASVLTFTILLVQTGQEYKTG